MQYLKQTEHRERKRYNCKWGEPVERDDKAIRHRLYNINRDKAIKVTHTKRIVWQEIPEAAEMRCAICGETVDANDRWTDKNGRLCYGRRYPTVDHIIPLKYGGTDTLDNVQLTCKRCNSAKGAKYAV